LKPTLPYSRIALMLQVPQLEELHFMPIAYIPYDLRDGYIHHWLVAGPQALAIHHLDYSTDQHSKVEIAQHYYEAESGIERLPVEPGPLDESKFTVGDYEGLWAYTRCGEDHFVDLSAFYSSYHYLRAWAYTQVECVHARTLALIVTAHGPADLWLNGSHIYRGETFGLHHDAIEASLQEGVNDILVRFEQVGARDCSHQFALRVTGPVHEMNTRVPTAIQDVVHRNRLEALFDSAYLDRDVFTRDETFTIYWPEELRAPDDLTLRLQTPPGRIYAEAKATAAPGQTSTLRRAYDVPQGPLRLRFLPPTELFYEHNLRVTREISLWGMGLESYSEAPYDTYPERRAQALLHALRGGGLFAEIARVALGQWDVATPSTLLKAVENINRREVDSALHLVGLLGLLYRWGDHPSFPAEFKESLEACILDFRGWDAGPEETDVAGESTEILLHAGEILAGQFYPGRTFSHSGQSGQWHRERGEHLALSWLRRRGAGGFAAWDSGRAFEEELVAMSHLVDLAETESVWQMVTVIMDKLLVSIALNAYRGVFGATQGAAHVTSIKGGLLAPTAGITRLLWGEGIFNYHLAGVVSIACMEDYELPPLTPEIAVAQHDELWNRESHVIGADQVINKVTYRTPDYLLGSVQDYRPGERGKREHIWQAILGPEAVVYTTHPASMGQGEGHAPGFWLGNATLPRVAQWKDVLIAAYKLPDDDWMGYTHAYFPAYAFDAHAMRETPQGLSWAFAQKGDGYLALTASRGLTWVTRGPGAYRELRAYGRDTIWCCQMGREALDGDFETFQERVLSLPLAFGGLTVQFQTLRGEALAFGWEGALSRAGEEESLSGFKHYENPYCITDLNASEMEIRSDQYLLRLKVA
jgi:hypothetical protein